jgi:hypothetical protein
VSKTIDKRASNRNTSRMANPPRDVAVFVRMSIPERDRLTELAQLAGLTISAYVRTRLLYAQAGA